MAPKPLDLAPTWTDESKKKQWYAGGIAYWEKTSETNDGVLGGYGIVHEADIEDSMKFLKPLLPKRDGDKKLRALDVGAGIGRITGALLLEVCDTVDLLEGARNFVTKAKEALAWAGDRVERYICEGMQDWVGEPGRYDLIWIQWCIGSLTDDDMVIFMDRCKQSLAPGGLIVLKDNIMDPKLTSLPLDKTGRFIVDEDDNSVIRAREHMINMLTRSCGLTILKQKDANLRRDDLFPVLLCALRA